VGSRSDSWTRNMVRFLSGKQHHAPSSRMRDCRLEPLEQRRLLSNGNILTEHAAMVDRPDVFVEASGLEKSIDPGERIPISTRPRRACMAGEMDVAIIGFHVTSGNASEFFIEYQVTSELVGNSISIAIFSSTDGIEAENPGTPLLAGSATPDSTEIQTFHLNANYPDIEDRDYYLIAKVDSNDGLEEANEENNLRVFEGGAYLAGSVVHIQAAIGPFSDTIHLEPLDGEILVTWQIDQDPESILNFSWASNEVTEFHIRTHDGTDSIDAGNLDKTFWVFGGSGNDLIRAYVNGGRPIAVRVHDPLLPLKVGGRQPERVWRWQVAER